MAATGSHASRTYCSSCEEWPGNIQDFRKIIDLKNFGLAIYRHIIKIPYDEKLPEDKNVEITKEIFILQNTRDVKISASEFLPEIENNLVSCSHCRKFIDHAISLLKNVPYIQKKEVRGVCDHCWTNQTNCFQCDKVTKKFMTSQLSESTKKEMREWLSKMKHILNEERYYGITTRKIRSIFEIIPTKLPTGEDIFKPCHSEASHIPLLRNKKPERPQSEREFSAPLFAERPVLADYAKKTLLKTGHLKKESPERQQNTSRFSRQRDSIQDNSPSLHSLDAEDIEHLLKKIAMQEAHYLTRETSTGRFRRSMESIAYKSRYSNVDAIDSRGRLEDEYPKHYKKKKYDDEADFDRKQRKDERVLKGQQYKGRYPDEEHSDRKRHIDDRMLKGKLYKARSSDEEDVDKKRHVDDIILKRRHSNDQDTDRTQSKDEKAGSQGRYYDKQDFDRKPNVEGRVMKGQQYIGRYSDNEDNVQQQSLDKRPSKSQQYKKQHLHEEERNQRDELSKKSTIEPRPVPKTISRELLLNKGLALKTDTLNKNYSFYFPKDANKTKSPKRLITSSQLIRETQEKLEAKAEEDNEKKRKEKLQAEQEKYEKKKEREEKAKFQKSMSEREEDRNKLSMVDKSVTAIPESDYDIDSKRIKESTKHQDTKEKSGKDIGRGSKPYKSKKVKKDESKEMIENKDKSAKVEKSKKGEKAIKSERDRKVDKIHGAKFYNSDKVEKRVKDQKVDRGDKVTSKDDKIGQHHQKAAEKEKSRTDSQDEARKEKSKRDTQEKAISKKFNRYSQEEARKGKFRRGSQEEASEKGKKSRRESIAKKRHKGSIDKSVSFLKKKTDKQEKEKKDSEKSAAKPDSQQGKRELNLERIKVVKSLDDVILKLVQVRKQNQEIECVPEPHGKLHERVRLHRHRRHKKSQICVMDEIISDEDIIDCQNKDEGTSDIIIGPKICKRMNPHAEVKDTIGANGDGPLICKYTFTEKKVDIKLPSQEGDVKKNEDPLRGIVRYALSNRTFIDKGWTMLPTEKVVRKMNVYRMRPSKPEFDWFKHNKNKRVMNYDTGEQFAVFDDNGHGQWFYKNGRVALDFYEAKELNAQQRFVIYSSGEPDEGRILPYTVLAVFDYLGNGVVYDHTGKIRLKFNQTEGVLLDRTVGPETHWKWHTLNDPPVLHRIMVDTKMSYKDSEILKLGVNEEEKQEHEDNEERLTIEFENFVKEKSMKLTQTFKPFQIKMKALKINKYFSLKVLDQATIYLIFRDGTTNLKLNIGMILDHKEIVDTDITDLGHVYNSLEKYPASTDSLARIQKSVGYAQNFEKMRLERERRFKIPPYCASVDKLTAAASRPMCLPLRTVPSCTEMSSNFY